MVSEVCSPSNGCIAGLSQLRISTGYAPLITEYIYFLLAKLAFHRQHPEFNGTGTIPPTATVLIVTRYIRVRGVHQFEVNQ
jgi:hypothetical protein